MSHKSSKLNLSLVFCTALASTALLAGCSQKHGATEEDTPKKQRYEVTCYSKDGMTQIFNGKFADILTSDGAHLLYEEGGRFNNRADARVPTENCYVTKL